MCERQDLSLQERFGAGESDEDYLQAIIQAYGAPKDQMSGRIQLYTLAGERTFQPADVQRVLNRKNVRKIKMSFAKRGLVFTGVTGPWGVKLDTLNRRNLSWNHRFVAIYEELEDASKECHPTLVALKQSGFDAELYQELVPRTPQHPGVVG